MIIITILACLVAIYSFSRLSYLSIENAELRTMVTSAGATMHEAGETLNLSTKLIKDLSADLAKSVYIDTRIKYAIDTALTANDTDVANQTALMVCQVISSQLQAKEDALPKQE